MRVWVKNHACLFYLFALLQLLYPLNAFAYATLDPSLANHPSSQLFILFRFFENPSPESNNSSSYLWLHNDFPGLIPSADNFLESDVRHVIEILNCTDLHVHSGKALHELQCHFELLLYFYYRMYSIKYLSNVNTCGLLGEFTAHPVNENLRTLRRAEN